MKIIVGLGNPGDKYTNTRHNIGFVVLDKFVDYMKLGSFVYVNKFKSEILEISLDGEKILFVKPMTFMNKSGEVVSQIVKFYKLDISDLIIIHDDIDIPISKFKLKTTGGAGGHNGVLNIIERLGTKDFHRIRIGVDRPVSKEEVINYVLGKFKKDEMEKITDIFPEVFDMIGKFIDA